MANKQTPDKRVQRSKDAVLKTTMELISKEGIARLSIDEVCARSGVAKTTIYRHWASRSELLLDACAQLGSSRLTSKDTGSLRGDVLALAHQIRALFQSKQASILPALMEAAERDNEMSEVLTSGADKMLDAFQSALDRASRRNEIRRNVSARDLAAAVVGPLIFARWLSRSSLTDAFVRKVVDRAVETTVQPL
jgi:AcrR family transcriptional regulator